jgi:kynureninase
VNLSRAAAAEADRNDPLAPFRDRFSAPKDPRRLYLDGNSLGCQPAAAPVAVAKALDAWRDDQILAWRDWIKLPRRLGDAMAGPVLEAQSGEIVFADSTSIDLYKLAAAALGARTGRPRIVTSDDNFPTDLYVLQSLARQFSLELVQVPADPTEGLDLRVLAEAVDARTALVCLSHVAYRSGALLDMKAFTRVAHAVDALVLWDLSHSAGAVAVPLESSGADLAAGCSYKYLNGGPGAPAYVYVRRELQDRLQQPLWGWFGRRDQFRMANDFEPAEGIDRFLSGAPSILSSVAIEPGIQLLAEAGIGALQEKGRQLTELIVRLADEWLAPFGVSLASPRDSRKRGSHVTLRHSDAKAIVKSLIADAVIPDFRPPDLIRLGPAPLYTRHVDVWDAMDRFRSICAR